MLRPAASAVVLSAFAAVLGTVTAMAATPPSPPPGSFQVQPISASAGAGTAGASTGQSWASGENQTAAHCGASAGVDGTSYTAEPQQVTSSGSSAPSCGTSSGSDGGAPATSGQTNNQGRSLGSGTGPGSVKGTATSGTGSGTTTGGLGALARWFGWLFLLMLLAVLFLLIGFAVGRRRREPATA